MKLIRNWIKKIIEEEVKDWYDCKIAREVSEEFDTRTKDLKEYDNERWEVRKGVYDKVDELVNNRIELIAESKVKQIENYLLVELVRRSLSFPNGEQDEAKN
ncbi:MAG: hypothetical protein IKB64_02075 [Paludibacteraceae bacterium]|nr:hypothetical protein [Paludibacteraceae bacterium]